MPVGRLRGIVAATEDPGRSVHEVLGAAARALAPVPPEAGPLRAKARAASESLIEQAGWKGVADNAPDRENLAATIEALMSLGAHPGALGRYDVACLPDDEPGERSAIVEQMVIGQVVGGELLTILQRLAEGKVKAKP